MSWPRARGLRVLPVRVRPGEKTLSAGSFGGSRSGKTHSSADVLPDIHPQGTPWETLPPPRPSASAMKNAAGQT